MLFYWLFSFAFITAGQAENRLPAECKNIPQYDVVVRKYGVNNDYTKVCRDTVASIMGTWQNMKVAKSRVRRTAHLGAGETQSGNLNDVAAVGEAGALTTEGYAQIAARAHTHFGSVAENLGKRIKQLEHEAKVVRNNASLAPQLKAEFHAASEDALEDFKKLRATANGLATEASQVSGEYRDESTQLTAFSRQNRDNAERLDGGNRQPAESPGVSKNLLIGLGGAALITAGAVGGLYWVSQKAISSADKAAAARIAQGEQAANNVIKNAEESAKRIITFATNSVNQIIANAQEAANQIYDRAKGDVDKLISDLRAEIQDTFKNLTETGLKKLKSELQSMFDGLIAKAKAAGDTALEEKLKKVWDSLNGQISSEIATRQSTGSSTATSSSTSTSTATSTGTGTSTSTRTSTSSGTVTNISTSTSTSSAYRQ